MAISLSSNGATPFNPNPKQSVAPLNKGLVNNTGVNLSGLKIQGYQPATPSTPVKQTSVTQPNGTVLTTSYHSPAKNVGSSSSTSPTSTPKTYSSTENSREAQIARGSSEQQPVYSGYINNSPTVSTSPMENAQNVSNAGGQSQNEYDTQKRLIDLGKGASPEYQAAQEEAKRVSENAVNYAKDYSQLTNNIAGTAGFLTQQTGLQGQLNNQYNTVQGTLANQYAGATNRLGAANTQQGLLNQAAGAAYSGAQAQAGRGLTAQQGLLTSSLPQAYSYGSQILNPLTGQPISPSNTSINDAVALVAQKVSNGTMAYQDAVSALSGYGQGGLNALQQALPKGFNVAQSNTLAGQQGSIKPAYNYAQVAMKNLENTIAGLGGLQSTNIPIINKLTQGASQISGVNSQAVQAFKAAIAEARGAIQKVLAATQGGTPTDYVGQSNALLPDNATPNQIKAAQETLKALGESKVGIYGNPGNSSNSSSSGSSNSIYNF